MNGSFRRRLLAAVCGLLSLLPAITWPASDDERFLEGLRTRRMFRTAEAYCVEKLAEPTLAESAKATLTIEYMLTLSQHALYAPTAEREALWRRAQQAAESFPLEHPRRALIDMQSALVLLAQGELARQEVEASNAEDYTAAQKLLREAVKQLEEVERRITQEIANQRGLAREGALTSDELFSLEHNTRFQLARARRNQALCYPAGSNDRVAALQPALEQLTKLQTQIDSADPLAARVAIDVATCQRLLEDHTSARQTLAKVLNDASAAALHGEAAAELARVELGDGKLSAAQRVLQQARRSAELQLADFEFAQLELEVALWKQAEAAHDKTSAARLRQQALTQLQTIEKHFGAYWSRRAQWLVIGSASPGEENLDILAKTADARFVKNEFDEETVRIYDQAARLALAESKFDRYLQLAYRAAIVQDRRQQRADAARRLIELGGALAEQATSDNALVAKAAAAHLQGLRWLQEDASTPVENLAAARERHLQLFATAPTMGTVAFDLAQQQEQNERPQEAKVTYQKVPASDPLFADACVRAARLMLEHDEQGHAGAEALLRKAIDAADAKEVSLRATAESLLVVALAGQPAKRAAAEKMLVDLGAESPAPLLEMLAGLTTIAQQGSPKVRRELAALQLQTIERLEPNRNRLSGAQQLALDRAKAEALLSFGKRAEAIAAYEQLAKQQPQSAEIQTGYATALASADDRDTLGKALAQWRTVAQRTRPRTDTWWRAKYEVAHLNYRLGDKPQAAQLIKYLQAAPPGLSGTPLEARFLELLKRCES